MPVQSRKDLLDEGQVSIPLVWAAMDSPTGRTFAFSKEPDPSAPSLPVPKPGSGWRPGPGLVLHDLEGLKGNGHYDWLYQTPACPPVL